MPLGPLQLNSPANQAINARIRDPAVQQQYAEQLHELSRILGAGFDDFDHRAYALAIEEGFAGALGLDNWSQDNVDTLSAFGQVFAALIDSSDEDSDSTLEFTDDGTDIEGDATDIEGGGKKKRKREAARRRRQVLPYYTQTLGRSVPSKRPLRMPARRHYKQLVLDYGGDEGAALDAHIRDLTAADSLLMLHGDGFGQSAMEDLILR
jgi:hypothetical protein